jgi:hypothetical protein
LFKLGYDTATNLNWNADFRAAYAWTFSGFAIRKYMKEEVGFPSPSLSSGRFLSLINLRHQLSDAFSLILRELAQGQQHLLRTLEVIFESSCVHLGDPAFKEGDGSPRVILAHLF